MLSYFDNFHSDVEFKNFNQVVSLLCTTLAFSMIILVVLGLTG